MAAKKAEGTTKKKKKRKTKKQVEEEAHLEAEWNRLMDANTENPFMDYKINGSFNQGDKINHKTFGEGVVGRLIYPDKIEVLFKDHARILKHAGPPEAEA